MKKFLLVALSLLLICGCSKKEFTDDKKCKDIGDVICDSLDDGQEYRIFNDTHMNTYFDDKEHYDDHHVLYSADTDNINEIGIFHAPDNDHADDLEEMCRDYVDDLKSDSRAFVASYAPEEVPKLDGASVKRFGNYVIYTVLPTEKADEIFDKLKNDLKK